MDKPGKFNFDEPLWSVPESVSDRLRKRQKNSEYTAFIFCGVYCVVAVFFLLIFGMAAWQRQETAYASVIFGFAGATIASYGLIWATKRYFLANHVTALLMGTLCLYLFYTGGTQGTGPVFYMAFPMVAVFLQGFAAGSLYILGLTLLTAFIYIAGAWGFDREQYDFVFITRITTVYLITSFLAVFYSYFKFLSERDLLLIYEDLELLTYGDQRTGLANRNLMQKLLNAEHKRFKRYGFRFSLMLVSIDAFNKIRSKYGQVAGDMIARSVAEKFRQGLREPDIPSMWDNDEFLIMLPQTGKEGARLVAERLCELISAEQFFIDGHAENTSVSIAVTEVGEEDLQASIQRIDTLLFKAIRQEGNCVVSD